MSDQLKKFVQLVKEKNLQHTNRYKFESSLPTALINLYREKYGTDLVLERLGLTASEVNIPGYSIAVSEIHVGSTAYVAFEKSNGDFSVTFISIGDHIEHKLFLLWRDIIVKDDHTLGFYDDYISEKAYISANNVIDIAARKVVIKEFFPSVVTDISLRTEGSNTFTTFQVTFKYRKLKNADTLDYASSAVDEG